MSQNNSVRNLEEVEEQVQAHRPDVSSKNVNDTLNANRKQDSTFPKSMIMEQLAFDPVEKGPFITVDNSPRSSRNVNVIKAKLREQESRHTLEIIRIKKEQEVREEALNTEISGLRNSLSDLQTRLETEVKLKEDSERRDEQTSKDLLVITRRCGELQGRLDESHAALQESRAYAKKLEITEKEKLAELRKQFAESGEKHQDIQRTLERKIRDLEEQLIEIRAGFQKALAEKLEQWKVKEAELLCCIKQKEEQWEKLCVEKNGLTETVEQLKIQLDEANKGRDSLVIEMGELRDFHRIELNNLRDEHANSQREWDEQMQNVHSELGQVQEQLNETRCKQEELITEKEKTMKKHEESIKVLKDALTVLDEQNKELTVELKRMHEKCDEKESVSATLATQVNTLLVERNEALSEKQKLLEDKSNLEKEVADRSNALREVTMQKDSEISNLQEELGCNQYILTKELDEKEKIIANLLTDNNNLQKKMEQSLKEKEDRIQEQAKKLEEGQSKVATDAAEIQELKQSLGEATEKLGKINSTYDGSKMQIAKLNLEMSRLINEVVKNKEQNIELKSGLDEALHKAEFYKDRNFSLTEQLAEIQRDKTEREADLMAEIKEKQDLIEYLKNQAAAATQGGSEKKKRRFFQTKSSPSTPSSPVKADVQKPTITSSETDAPPPAPPTEEDVSFD